VPASDDEATRVIGDLRLSIPLYNVYLNEADEWSRRLQTSLGEWALELHEPVPDTAVALAHSLAGSSAHRGLQGPVLAGAHAGARPAACAVAKPGHRADARAFVDAADDIRRLLHQFAAGFLKEPQPAVVQALEAILATEAGVPMPEGLVLAEPPEWIAAPTQASNEPAFEEPAFDEPALDEVAVPPEAASQALSQPTDEALPESLPTHVAQASYARQATEPAYDDEFDAVDVIDPDLFPIFEEEALELLPRVAASLRHWQGDPTQAEPRAELLRLLHTLKGSAVWRGPCVWARWPTAWSRPSKAWPTPIPTRRPWRALVNRLDGLQANFGCASGLQRGGCRGGFAGRKPGIVG